MFEIRMYRDASGYSPVADFLTKLSDRAHTDKSSRMRLAKIYRYFTLLEMHGTRIGLPTTRHIENDIWELRPTNDRLFFAYWKEGVFIILHHYVKKSQKMPQQELEQAKRNLVDFLKRSE